MHVSRKNAKPVFIARGFTDQRTAYIGPVYPMGKMYLPDYKTTCNAPTDISDNESEISPPLPLDHWPFHFSFTGIMKIQTVGVQILLL